MAFYGVYHRNPINQLIHVICIPLILWTMTIFYAHLPVTDRVVVDFLPGIPAHYRKEAAPMSLELQPIGPLWMEIAVALGIPEGTVKSRLFNARNQLKHALEKEKIHE